MREGAKHRVQAEDDSVKKQAYDCKAVMKDFTAKGFMVRLGRAWLEENGILKQDVWEGKEKQFPPLKAGQIMVVCYSAGAGWKIARRTCVLSALRKMGGTPPPPKDHSWRSRESRECAKWLERIEAAKQVILTRHPNAEIRLYACIFIQHAESILHYFDDAEKDEWCLTNGTRPTREELDTFRFNLASTAFQAGEYWRALRDALGNEKLMRVAKNIGRGRPVDAKSVDRDDLKATLLSAMREHHATKGRFPTWLECIRILNKRPETIGGQKLRVESEESLVLIGTRELRFGTVRNLLTECRRELQKDAAKCEKVSCSA